MKIKVFIDDWKRYFVNIQPHEVKHQSNSSAQQAKRSLNITWSLLFINMNGWSKKQKQT